MKVVMISTDPKLLDPQSSVSLRMEKYAGVLGPLTILLTGLGEKKDIRRERVRVVYPGGWSKIDNFFRIVRALRAEPATVLSAQDPFWTGLAAVWSGVRPLQIQLHAGGYGRIGALLMRYTLPRATCVRVVSEALAAEVKRFTAAPVFVLPIFVDAAPFAEALPRPAEYGDHPVLLTVSRLAPEKRLDRVIAAMKRIPKAHLYIVGDGPESLKLKAQSRELGGRVHFLGWKNDVRAYYQHADCFVQASAYESYGMSLIEAVLSGVPAVSTDVGVARETGVTIVAGDEYGLASGIATVLRSDEARAAAKAAQTGLASRMPSEVEYLKQYEQLLKTCTI